MFRKLSEINLPMIEKTNARFAFLTERNDIHFWTDAWFVQSSDVQ